MKRIGIFYGSSTGNTEDVAAKLAANLDWGNLDVFDVSKKISLDKLNDYDILLLGASTWGAGELQDDWNINNLKNCNLTGKKIGIFGTGDSATYPTSFCDALGVIAQVVCEKGGVLIGNKVDQSDYTFDSSEGLIDGYLCGLAIDQENEPDKTDERISRWIEIIQENM